MKQRASAFTYALKDGERWLPYEGLWVVAHPDREPKVVYEDGSEEPLRPVIPTPGQSPLE